VRFGYTTSFGVYLPAEAANRTTIWIDSGSASLYAGRPDQSPHRLLATLNAGQYYIVNGLASDEVLSVQNDYDTFTYQIDIAEPGDPPPEVPPPGNASRVITWTCTGAPCPWGLSTANDALVWPTSAEPTSSRLGYTTSEPIYLGAGRANGTSIHVLTGSASLYAGDPDASSHRLLATVNAGDSFEVSGLAPGEVLSAQSTSSFTFEIDVPAEEPEGSGSPVSPFVTWACTSSPCPWGESTTGYALEWPADSDAVTARLGYTTSKPIYLPWQQANGTVIAINAGSAASVYAGLPGAPSHRVLATIYAGTTYEVSGVAPGEVISVQANGAFSYEVSLAQSTPDPDPPVLDPNLMYSIPAYWYCDIAECSGPPWTGRVINWPSWAAYSSNARAGSQSRTVYSDSGQLLTPYMGAWANGCEVTAHHGQVLIIEWERGTDVWRETYIQPGETHVIQLTGAEDGALIESNDYEGEFAISVSNCTPQPLP
jgi:hypothetical protein